MVVDTAVAKEREQSIDLLVGNRLSQTNAVDVRDRDEHRGVIGNNAKVKKSAGGTENRFLFDALDDPEPVIWVDDLVADLKCHVFPRSR